MIVKCLYRKNLKMSPQKLSAQVAHAVSRLCLRQVELGNIRSKPEIIRVLMASDKKFFEKEAQLIDMESRSGTIGSCYCKATDLGLTEIPADTDTVLAFLEEE